MFGLFRKKSNNTSHLSNWNIDPGPEFRMIRHPDSIQYASADEGIVLYFSVLVVSGNGPLTGGVVGQPPNVSPDGDGWQLKGVKTGPGHVLVCVISCRYEKDIGWARSFFDGVTYSDRR